MDVDDFIKKELYINGKIINLVHHLTYFRIKELLLKYERMCRICNKNLPSSGSK